jgi:AcrR family transcriptional regulator
VYRSGLPVVKQASLGPVARPSDTKQRIQAVARELFAQQGVQRTSLREIADRLGITKPALYYHFASREELVRSIIQPLFDELEQFVAQRDPGQPQSLLESYFELIWRHRDVLVMIIRAPGTLVELNLMDRMWQWRLRLTELLVGPDDVTATTQIRATVAIGGMSDCAVEHGHRDFDEVKKAAIEAALAALGSGTAG